MRSHLVCVGSSLSTRWRTAFAFAPELIYRYSLAINGYQLVARTGRAGRDWSSRCNASPFVRKSIGDSSANTLTRSCVRRLLFYRAGLFDGETQFAYAQRFLFRLRSQSHLFERAAILIAFQLSSALELRRADLCTSSLAASRTSVCLRN